MTAETATAWTTVPEPRVRLGQQAVETESDDVIDQLRAEVERTLAAVRPEVVAIPLADGQHAEPALRRAARAVLAALPAEPAEDALRQSLACVEAACEHLHYGELVEARMLLVAARGQLARAITGRDRYHRVTSGSDAPAAVSGAAKIP